MSIAITCHNNLFGTAGQIEMACLLKTLPSPILAFCRSGARSTNLYQLALQVS